MLRDPCGGDEGEPMLLRPMLLAGLFAAMTVQGVPAAAADRAIIVLDASGSMWGQIDGRPKLEIARETLRKVLPTFSPDLELGLMAYGHRERGNCADIELVVQPGAGTAGAISTAVDRMSFLGKTPLSQAVKEAAEAMRYTEDKATVVLITDGIETCNADPCALASELEKAGIDFTAHVVGFGLTEEEGRQVACLAENTGGKYIQAQDADALTEALTQTVAEVASEPTPEPEPEPTAPDYNFLPQAVLSEGGEPLPEGAGNAWEVYRASADGTRGEHLDTSYNNGWRTSLEPGNYVVAARQGMAEVEQPVTIEPGEVDKTVFVLNAGVLKVRPLAVAGGDPVDAAAVVAAYPGGETTGYGATTFTLPAGEQKLTVRIGAGEVTETLTLKAGETLEKDVVVGVGRAVLNAAYVPGMKVEESGLYVQIFKAAKKIDGSRDSVAYGYGPDTAHEIPPGDYVLLARMAEAEAETSFSVKVGETTNAEVVLDAGVLAISAPGADFIEILSAKKDIQGKRKSLTYGYGESLQTTLGAGNYVVMARLPNDAGSREIEAKVVAGERTEATVPLP